MNSDITRLLSDDNILEAMRVRLENDGFREKTAAELLDGAKKITEVCPRSALFRAIFALKPEKEIRPLIDSLFPYLSFNRTGWYAAALRILGESVRETLADKLSESDIKKLIAPDASEKAAAVRGASEAAVSAQSAETAAIAEAALPVTIEDRLASGGASAVSGAATGGKQANIRHLPVITPQISAKLLEAFENDPYVIRRDREIGAVIEKAGAENTDFDRVLIKVEAFISLFGISGADKKYAAERIRICGNIDEYIVNGDEGAVEMLEQSLSCKKKDYYMFAVCYCAAHKPEKYPYFNSAVVRALKYYRDAHGFYYFADDELRDYPKYKKLLNIFRKKYSLEKYSLSEISRILTAAGKLLENK